MTRNPSYVVATIPALVVLGFFVWFANWIPQTRWSPPEKQDIGAAMTPPQLAKVGKIIVRQRGCLACHTIEPTAGVNPVLTESLLTHITGLRDSGKTLIFVEHDMDVVHEISDWVIVLAEGRVIAEGPPEVIARDPAVIDAYLGAHHGEAAS